jgi:hypothetical protein
LASWNLLNAGVNLQPELTPQSDHFVGSGGRAADAKESVALLQELHGNGMKHFIEHVITCPHGAVKLSKRQSQPFSQHGNMSSAKD